MSHAGHSLIPAVDIDEGKSVRDWHLWPDSIDQLLQATIVTQTCKYHPSDGGDRYSS